MDETVFEYFTTGRGNKLYSIHMFSLCATLYILHIVPFLLLRAWQASLEHKLQHGQGGMLIVGLIYPELDCYLILIILWCCCYSGLVLMFGPLSAGPFL